VRCGRLRFAPPAATHRSENNKDSHSNWYIDWGQVSWVYCEKEKGKEKEKSKDAVMEKTK